MNIGSIEESDHLMKKNFKKNAGSIYKDVSLTFIVFSKTPLFYNVKTQNNCSPGIGQSQPCKLNTGISLELFY